MRSTGMHGSSLSAKSVSAGRPRISTSARPRHISIKKQNLIKVCATAAPAGTRSMFGAVDSEEALFALLRAGQASGKIPDRMIDAVNELYNNYKSAILSSGLPGADEAFVAKVMSSVCERVLMQLTPDGAYTFPSFHQRILEPYNYYNFGQRYIRGLVDFSKSVVGHVDRFAVLREQLKAGHNVVLLANHQTEADPAVFALLLEAEFPELATDVIYVAGDRVVTDPLCKPFSMGRNLFCVHSKKHLDDVPELKAEKMAMNRRTLRAMQSALNEGGKLLWIAPSGGRDRSVDPVTGENTPDRFDASAVELMRALLTKASHPGHIYPLAMYSYRIMPPPKSVEKAIGERRLVFHAPVGISLCEEMELEALAAGAGEDKEAKQQQVADAAWQQVCAEYAAIMKITSAEEEKEKPLEGDYSQPWTQYPMPPLDQWLSP